MVAKLLDTYKDLEESVSATTRPPRKNEIEDKDYFFLNEEQFKQALREGKFLEYERVHGNLYGTLKSEVEGKLKKSDLILELDTKGAFTVKRIYGDRSVLVFITVPSIEELKNRLEARKTDSEVVIDRRIKQAENEIKQAKKFDYCVLNDKMDKAYRELESVVNKEREKAIDKK